MLEIEIKSSSFELLSLKLKFEKNTLTYFGKLHGCQFICLIFAVFFVFFVLVLVLIDSVLARSVPVQSQYLKNGPVPVPVPVHQYQI
jgi:hypothetical protein